MNEKEALRFWRDLDPYPAALLRRQTGALKDPIDYAIRVPVKGLTSKQLLNLLKMAAERGCDSQVVVSNGTGAILLTKGDA